MLFIIHRRMWFVFSRSFDIYSCSDVVGQSDLAMITSYKATFLSQFGLVCISSDRTSFFLLRKITKISAEQRELRLHLTHTVKLGVEPQVSLYIHSCLTGDPEFSGFPTSS